MAAFASGQIIRMIAARWLGLAPLATQHFDTDAANLVVMGDGHNRHQPVLRFWDDMGTVEKR